MMRFKSIFSKLLTYYLGTTMIVLILLAILINFFLQDFLYTKKNVLLFQKADKILHILQQSENSSNGSLFNTVVNDDKKNENIRVNLFLLQDKNNAKKLQRFHTKMMRRWEIRDPEFLNRVLSGERVSLTGRFQKGSDQSLLTVGVPITSNGKIVGALFLHTPVQEVPTSEVSKLILYSFLIIMFPSTLILYFVSRKISKPLVEINHSAHLFGEGNFKKRLEIKSQDEVGQLAATFNTMADQLEKLESMRKDLLMNVSHELRTPLTSIRGFIQGMLDDVIPPEQHHRYLEICYSEMNRVSNLVTAILDLATIESGKMEINERVIRWPILLESVAEVIRVKMDQKGIIFTMQPEEKEPIKVIGDPERIKQILFNLLDNAIRHTPEGGCISISSKTLDNELEVTISDSGEGIEAKNLPYIWERFFKEVHSHHTHRERSGLGLPISKQLAELMGGRITATSIKGTGTSFMLYLRMPTK